MSQLGLTTGSFRQRQRLAEKTTGMLEKHKKSRAALQTHAAIAEFEERLQRAQEEALRGPDDDLPLGADLMNHSQQSNRTLPSAGRLTLSRSGQIEEPHTRSSSRSSSDQKASSKSTLGRNWSDPTMSKDFELDVDVRRAMRPPSPLGVYNYGSISCRPRSLLAQTGKPSGGPWRQPASSTRGFYFPGADMRQGPYGFSMLDPIHLPPRNWVQSTTLPMRWVNDPTDARPAQPGRHQSRNHKDAPTLSETVRPSRAHELRARRVFDVLDKKREETLLEKIRFEQGVFEGKWRDPLLDVGASLLHPSSEEKHEFLASEQHEGKAPRDASKILFGLERALREGKGNLQNLFRAVSKNTPNVLEADEFLEGLARLGIVRRGDLSPNDLVEAMILIDPTFDGRVNFTVLSRALAAAAHRRRQKVSAKEMADRQDQHIEHNTYHASLPVDVVKVDWRSRSLFDFVQDFDKFREQQKELLQQHNEAARE